MSSLEEKRKRKGLQLNAFIRIIRIPNDLAIMIAVIVAMLISRVQEIAPLWYIILAGVVGFLVSAHGMVINDIIDFEIDTINAPSRPLPSGQISLKQARVYAWVLGSLALVLAVTLDLKKFAIYPLSWLYALFHLLLLDAYNLWLKRTGLYGNIIVSYSAAAVLLYADIFYNGHFTLLPSMLALVGFTSNMGREITKGIIDVDGDKAHGVRTIAVLFGVRTAQVTSIIFYVLSIGEILIIMFKADVGILGLLGAFSFLLLLLAAIFVLLKGPTIKNARLAKTFILYGFLVALLLFLIDVFVPIPAPWLKT